MASNETKFCQGKDVFERMNFLYQASRLVSKSSEVAASYYGKLMVSCAKKAVLRMEPDIKRTICKSCHSPLVPGETARIRLVSKPVKAVKWTCLRCKATRRIPTKKGYKLWSNEPESVVQVFDYTERMKVTVPEIKSTMDSAAESHPKQLGTVEGKKQENSLPSTADLTAESQPIEMGTVEEKQEDSLISVAEGLSVESHPIESGMVEERKQEDSSASVAEQDESRLLE